MDTLFVSAVVIGVLWFVLSGRYRTQVQDARTLKPEQLEDSIIELKKKILVTSAYNAKSKYQRLYYRLKELMVCVLERHKHYVLDFEASGGPQRGQFQPYQYHDADGMTFTAHGVPHNIDPSRHDPKFLIYTCFFLWQGGQAKDIGEVDANPDLMLKILNYLIEEKNYGPAIFFKGMVMKYGMRVYSECFPEEARQLLLRSQVAGVGAAAVELAQIDKYHELKGIKSIQIGE